MKVFEGVTFIKDSLSSLNEGIKNQTSPEESCDDAEERARRLQKTLMEISDSLERAKIGDYVDLMNKPRRLIYLNLLAGLFRGMGLAVGFTLLGALVIYLLTRNFILNLPYIGNFLGELVWIIQQYLRTKP